MTLFDHSSVNMSREFFFLLRLCLEIEGSFLSSEHKQDHGCVLV